MPIPASFSARLMPMLPELVKTYGTPFHIYDEAGILANHRMICAAFADHPVRQYFAVKALPNPAVLEALVAEGSGLDCSSPHELTMAVKAGAHGDAVVFTSNNTTPGEYEAALAAGAVITFDDILHMRRAPALPEIVAFRIAPHGLAARSSLMGNAGQSKFGVPVQHLAAAYREARDRGATRFGIHGMICANELDPANAERAARDLVDIAVSIERDTGIRFEYVNFGGGLGIPYMPEDRALDFTVYARSLIDAIEAGFPGRRPRILLELGRYVSGPYGVLIARVTNRMEKERIVVGLDASMSALMRPGFYRTAYHHITLPFVTGRQHLAADIVGSLCENVDRFAVDRSIPDPREGDIVMIHDTGAHGHAMGFTYNARLRPAELLLRADGSVEEIRRAETYADYTATLTRKTVIKAATHAAPSDVAINEV
ncbi:MAG: diaminopimelate decarboxylase [Salinarimonas sp.]